MNAPDPRKGALLSLTSALSGAAFLIPYKLAGAGDAPHELVVMAMVLAAAGLNTAVFLGGRLRAGRAARSAPRRSVRLMVLVALVLAGFTVLGNWAVVKALSLIGPGLTNLVQQTQVLFVAAASALLLGERITARYAAGAVIALAGFAVMRLPGQAGGALELGGMLWALVSALSFGAMHVLTRKVIQRIDPVPVNALRLWLAVALLACWPGRLASLAGLAPRTWALAAAAAFLGPFLGRICLMYAVRHISASHATLLNLTGPVFAFSLGFLAFGTAPTLLQLAGGALILTGIALPVLELAAGTPVSGPPAPRLTDPRGSARPGPR